MIYQNTINLTFVLPNSDEHEINAANEYSNANSCWHFKCLMFSDRLNFMFIIVENEKTFYNLAVKFWQLSVEQENNVH